MLFSNLFSGQHCDRIHPEILAKFACSGSDILIGEIKALGTYLPPDNISHYHDRNAKSRGNLRKFTLSARRISDNTDYFHL